MYTLNLTESDINTICFVGNRYGWSLALLYAHVGIGKNVLTESEAWEIKKGIDEDMKGNHGAFPMLDSRSELAEKLTILYESIV